MTCVNDQLNQVFVFIHPLATFPSVLSAAKEPRLQFCCGGVVREALLSVRVRTGRCPLGTERKNCVQGSTEVVLQWTLEGLATTWLVSQDTRCVLQLQAGLAGLGTAARHANCEYLKRQPLAGWLDFTFAV